MKKRIYLSVDEEIYREAKSFLGDLGHLPKLAEIAFWHFMQLSDQERHEANADFHFERKNRPLPTQHPRLQVIQGGYENEISA